MDLDVVSYLASKGLRGRAASGGREMTYPCCFDCQEPPGSKKKKLYVSTSNGLYNCKVCGASGGPYTLQKHFGDEPSTGTNDDIFARQRILDAATATGVTILNNNEDALLYLIGDRGLDPETIEGKKLGFIAGSWSLIDLLPEGITKDQVKSSGLVHRDGRMEGKDFFYRHLLIPIQRHGHTVQLRGRAWGESRGGKYMTGPGEPTRVYNADSVEDAEDVIITEGEFDAMILEQELAKADEPRARKIAVIGLPGTDAWPDELVDLLSDAKRIFIGFDSDDPGRKAAEKLKTELGPRARILALPNEDDRKCDWTEYLLPSKTDKAWKAAHPYTGHNWRDVMRLLSTASGKRIFSVAESGEAYRAHRSVNSGLRTGYMPIDSVLRPGLLPGQVMIILAKTGAGKTVFLCNLAVNMRAQRILYVSLEMTREEIYDRLRRIYCFHHPRASDAEVDRELANVYICDENRLGEKDLGNLISEFAIEAGGKPDVVFIDYLGYYARGQRGNSPYEKTTNAAMQLKAEAKAGRFVVIAPSQVNRFAKEGKAIDIDDARDSGAVEETADFLMALWRPDDGLNTETVINNAQPSGVVNMSVLKSRHGGKGKVFRFQMDVLTLAVVEEDSGDARRARQHNDQSWRGLSWEELRKREGAPIQTSMQFEGAQQ